MKSLLLAVILHSTSIGVLSNISSSTTTRALSSTTEQFLTTQQKQGLVVTKEKNGTKTYCSCPDGTKVTLTSLPSSTASESLFNNYTTTINRGNTTVFTTSTAETVASTTSTTVTTASKTSTTATTTPKTSATATTAPTTSTTITTTPKTSTTATTTKTSTTVTITSKTPTTATTAAPTTIAATTSTTETTTPKISTTVTTTPKTSTTAPTTSTTTTASSTTKTPSTVDSSTKAPTTKATKKKRKVHLSNTQANKNSTTLATNITATASTILAPDPQCSEVCRNHYTTTSLKQSTIILSTKKTVAKPTTEKHPNIAPKWDAVTLKIQLRIVINTTFKEFLKKPETEAYNDFREKYKNKLWKFFNDTPHFKRIDVDSFSNGSVVCKFSVVLDTENVTKPSVERIIKYIRENKASTEQLKNLKDFGDIEISKTETLMNKDLLKAEKQLRDLCKTYGTEVCEFDHKCVILDDQYQKPYCVYRCNVDKSLCGKHGTCSVDENGSIACKCKEDPLYVFHGERCDIKEEKLLLSKNYIIAITAGGGGAVILILFIAMICLCRKWNKAKRATQFYRNRSTKSLKDRESVAYEDDKGMQMENSRIENVYMGKYGHDNNSYMVDSAPSTDDSIMRYEKGRYYRVVKDPELGADTFIYQPSNLNIPIQRESTISRDDEPDPLRTHHDYIDTDSVYKIKRPNVRTNTFDRNGHPRTVL